MAKRLRNKRVVEYEDAFKLMVVKLTELEGVQIKQISDSLDLHPFMVSRWRKQFRDGQLVSSTSDETQMAKDRSPPKSPDRAELDQLKKQNARLKKENNFLKKWQRYLKELRQNDSRS